jgi:hypothetical protein
MISLLRTLLTTEGRQSPAEEKEEFASTLEADEEDFLCKGKKMLKK